MRAWSFFHFLWLCILCIYFPHLLQIQLIPNPHIVWSSFCLFNHLLVINHTNDIIWNLFLHTFISHHSKWNKNSRISLLVKPVNFYSSIKHTHCDGNCKNNEMNKCATWIRFYIHTLKKKSSECPLPHATAVFS